jgi:hypothetical protein
VSDAGEFPQALLLLVTGGLLAVVGHLGSRRATMWIGVAFVTLGAGLLVIAIAGSDASITVQGFLVAMAGVGLVVLAWWLLRKHPLDRFAAPAKAAADQPAPQLRPPAMPPPEPRSSDLRPPDSPPGP